MHKKVLAAALVISFMAACQAHAEEGTIGHIFKHKPVTMVYVNEVSDATGQAGVSAAKFKKILETSLLNRRSMTFKMAASPAESDIQVSATINKFRYMEKGPLKPGIGISTMILDAAATATGNYVEMAVDFTVVSTKGGDVLWRGQVEDYLKRSMTAEEGFSLISDKITRQFIWRCFGRANFRLKRGVLL